MTDSESSAELDMLDPASRRVGMTLSGKWRLEKLLGVGGMAAVYEGHHRNGAKAAIKYFSLATGAGSDSCARLLREGYLANRIEHPSVVRVLDDHIDVDKEHAYLVMELLDGESLQDHVERSGLLSPKRAAELMIDLCACLEVAHAKSVVHRDIKPENLFLDKSGLRVLDFGIARALDSNEGVVTRTGSAIGTPAYMAPEQAMGKKEISAQTDIYAVGATMLYLLTGAYLHDVDSAQEMMVRVAWTQAEKVRSRFERMPAPLAEVIDRACTFKAENRFESAEQLRAALQEILEELPDLPLARISSRSSGFSAAPTVSASDERSAAAITPRDAPTIDSPVSPGPGDGADASAPKAAQHTVEPTTTKLEQAGPAPPSRARVAALVAIVAAVAAVAFLWWSQSRAIVSPTGPETATASPSVTPVPTTAKDDSVPEVLPAPREPVLEPAAPAAKTKADGKTRAPAPKTPALRAKPAPPLVTTPAVKPAVKPSAPGATQEERDLGY